MNDVVVLTGTGGIGLAIARRLAAGRRTLLADFSEPALTSAAEALRDEGHDVTTLVTDVSDREAVAALADAAAELGRVTHVVHTAGLSPEQAAAEAVLRVDLRGVALVLDEFARVVAPGGAGVVIASMAGHLQQELPVDQQRALATTPAAELLDLPFLSPDALGPQGAYAISKRANALRVQAAANTWGRRGARVNSISPGIIATAMGRAELDGPSGQTIRAMVDRSGTGRIGTPDDIADAAAFLLGPQATFITGTDLLVDGGVVASMRA
ncbi:SDR family oxidoreductase [Amycolatopsis sp. 195334CR]|uniref:SDR family oxidoreductase n=1 Tax=Amycolatopsis sp. 195334CR TaxID=2814588 RepID=UPI001A8D1270|nr:SDR family oxidoreductase [Amycolatopsis sp. 195334CR]MBN6039667.1 SDR family oxidoreductase [Amycolatopsis sp. 195334CR]